MPFMFGVANKIKQSRIVSKLRSSTSKAGNSKKKIIKGQVPIVKKQKREKKKDYTISCILITFTLIIISACFLVPSLGLGGIIVPIVLAAVFLFILIIMKQLFTRD